MLSLVSGKTKPLICIKDCSFKEEKTIVLWDFVFSEGGMDSLEQQWIDEKMIMDGLKKCMDECDE